MRNEEARVAAGLSTTTDNEQDSGSRPASSNRGLRGEQCQCAVCGLVFTGVRPFDDHRRVHGRGVHDVAGQRRCRTETELLAEGWRLSARGWSRPARRLEVAHSGGKRRVAA